MASPLGWPSRCSSIFSLGLQSGPGEVHLPGVPVPAAGDQPVVQPRHRPGKRREQEEKIGETPTAPRSIRSIPAHDAGWRRARRLRRSGSGAREPSGSSA